jgi:hypothetical protein
VKHLAYEKYRLKDQYVGMYSELNGTVTTKRNACWFLVRKREGKRPLRRSRRRWDDEKIK